MSALDFVRPFWAMGLLVVLFLGISPRVWSETPAVWVTHALEKVFPDTQPPAEAKSEIVLKVGRNDTEDAQVVVRVPQETTVANAYLETADLKGDHGGIIAKDQIFAWWIWYTYVLNNPKGNTDPSTYLRKAPAFFPDAFLEQRTIRIRDEWTQPLWVSVHIPKDTAPGEYTGVFNLHITANQEPMVYEIPVRITVWDFTLPDEFHLHHTEWFSYWGLADYYRISVGSEEFWAWVERVAADMARHKQDMIITPLTALVAMKQVAPGEFVFDFTMLDRWIETFKKAGVTWIEGSHVGGRSSGWESLIVWGRFRVDGVDTASLTEEEFEPYVEAFLRAVYAHLKEKNWADRYVQHIADEPIAANADSWIHRAAKVKTWMPEVPLLDAVILEGLEGYIDIRVPQIQDIKPGQKRHHKESLWSYVCLSPQGAYPNRFLDYPLIRNRILFWLSWSMRLEGFLHWGYNYWQTWPEVPVTLDVSPWLDATGASIYVQDRQPLPAGDPFIVYPGRKSICSSMRWEDVRNGMEDFEYLYLLERAIAKPVKGLRRETRLAARRLLEQVRGELAAAPDNHTHDETQLLSVRDQVGDLLAQIARETGMNR